MYSIKYIYNYSFDIVLSVILLSLCAQWFCDGKFHFSVLLGGVPLCLHLLERSAQGHVGR